MALIPNLRGDIVCVQPVDHHYYKSEIVMDNSYRRRGWSEDKEYELGTIIVRFRVPVDQFILDCPFSQGDSLSIYAFEIEDGMWEGEGVTNLSARSK